MTNLLNAQWNDGYGLEALQNGVTDMKLAEDLFFELIDELQHSDKEACRKIQFIRSSYMDKLDLMDATVKRFMNELNDYDACNDLCKTGD